MRETSRVNAPGPPIKAGEIVVSHVSKSYGGEEFRKDVVKDCSFTIERAKLTVMIGPSGCGKSTLIRLLAGFEKPTEGTITLNGEPVDGPARDRLVPLQGSGLVSRIARHDKLLVGPPL